jgi:CheY-like chemotaxis protein
MLTPSAARTLGRHAGMGFELLGGDNVAKIKLRAHVESMRQEITNPGLSTTTQVLLVEPSPPLRTRMQRALESAGFKITAVSSVPEALQACAVWRPDAVVSASQMDGMTGIDLAYAMSEHATISDVPIVLTGDDADIGRLEAFRAGVRDYIPKPFIDEELVIRTHRAAAPQTSSVSPGLRGALGDISLGTLLSLFEFERKSGVLLLLHEGDVARVFVSEGRVLKVEASRGGITPRDRLMRLLDWRAGHFEFSPCAVGGRDEIGLPIMQILLEHARRSDEASNIG